MQAKDHRDINRRPRQIEDGMDSGPGDELAELFATLCFPAASAADFCRLFDDGGHHPWRDLLIKPDACACQNACAYCIQTRERRVSHQQRNSEHEQRDLTGARDDAVIDLQHVEWAGQIEQVDGQAEYSRGDEVALAALQQSRQFVGPIRWIDHEIRRQPVPPRSCLSCSFLTPTRVDRDT